MQKSGVTASDARFNLLLSAFAKVGVMAEAERAYSKLNGAGLKPDFVSCRNMWRDYMDYGHVEEEIKFFRCISESTEAERFIMSCAVHLYWSVGEEQKAASILDSDGHFGNQVFGKSLDFFVAKTLFDYFIREEQQEHSIASSLIWWQEAPAVVSGLILAAYLTEMKGVKGTAAYLTVDDASLCVLVKEEL